jgi:FKBP-type peptidyl-prolyl cis-trans isomerase FkpA
MIKTILPLSISTILMLLSITVSKTVSAQSPSVSATEVEQHSYAFGAYLGSLANEQLLKQGGLGVPGSKSALSEGFDDILNGNSKYTIEEIHILSQAFSEKIEGGASISNSTVVSEIPEVNTVDLTENGKREGVVTTKSGLQYEVLIAGNGARPAIEDKVRVHYHGSLLDGTTIDSSIEKGTSEVFPVNGVIKGWIEGLQLMNVGSKYRFFIPSELAFGKRGRGAIPGNSPLVYDIELLAIAI